MTWRTGHVWLIRSKNLRMEPPRHTFALKEWLLKHGREQWSPSRSSLLHSGKLTRFPQVRDMCIKLRVHNTVTESVLCTCWRIDDKNDRMWKLPQMVTQRLLGIGHEQVIQRCEVGLLFTLSSNIYALGAKLLVLFTGRQVWPGLSPFQIMYKVSVSNERKLFPSAHP